MMHFKPLAITAVCTLLSLTACGGGDDDPPQTFTTQILSDSGYDGDIEQTTPDTATVTQGMSPTVQTVLAGIDPVAGTEFRAFLDFPLTGPGGVPGNAAIDSAFLEVFIDDLQPADAVVPVRVELVTFQPPTLLPTDFDRTLQPPLAFTIVSPPLARADVGTYVPIDVTALMVEAQRGVFPIFRYASWRIWGRPLTDCLQFDDSTGANRAARRRCLQ